MISYVDYAIGKILDGLDQMELTDETMIVFMSDNGAPDFTWDNYPLRGAKGTLYEGGIRVPMIIKWQGVVPPGTQTDTPVHIVDMFPTFVEVANGSIPNDKKLDGKSLVPVLTRDEEFEQRQLYWHHPHYLHDYGKTPSSAIRDGKYKLIYYYGDYLDTKGHLPASGEPYGELKLGERIELFNLNKNPYERNDLSQKLPQKTKKMCEKLMEWLQETNASIPSENPDAKVPVWYETANRND
jgi:arylsulfatase A-like enzyme